MAQRGGWRGRCRLRAISSPEACKRGNPLAHVLHAYEVSVRKKGDQAERMLGNFDDAGADLLVELQAFLQDPDMASWVDEDAEAAAEVAAVYPPTQSTTRVLAATVKAG